MIPDIRKGLDVREPLISATFILDSDETILEMMGDAEVVLGISRKAALKKPLAAVGAELDHMLKGLLDKAKKGRGVENYAFPFKLDKHLLALRASAIPYPLAALGKTGILVTMVSQEEKEVQAFSPEAEPNKPIPIPGLAEELDVARDESLASFADPVFILNAKGGMVYANPSFQKLMEAGWEELRTSHLSTWLATSEPRKVVEQIIETVHLAPWRGELDLRTRTGRGVVLSLTFSRLEESKGKPGAVLACAQDFTELRRIERERVADEARSLGRLESATACIFTFSAEGRITFFNREAEKVFSLSAERAAGMTLEEVMGRENCDRMLELAARAKDGRGNVPATLVMPGRHGRERYLRAKAAVPDTGGEVEIVAVAEEVTEAEDLKAGVERSAQAMEFLSACIALSSPGDSPEETLAGFLAEAASLTGSSAGAVYRIEEDQMDLVSSHGHPASFARKAGTLRIRPGRLEVLEAHAGALLDLAVDPAPDSTNSPRILFRDWDDYRQAHLEEELPAHLLLPLKSGGGITGMVVLAGLSSMQIDPEHLRALEWIAPWICLVMDAGRPAGDDTVPADIFDDQARRRMAHELSTPLTYVRGFTQMLAADRDQLSAEALDEVITNIDEGTARLVEIVDGYMPHPEAED